MLRFALFLIVMSSLCDTSTLAAAVEVPDLTGLPVFEAENRVTDLGLTFESKPVDSSEPRNSVVAHIPVVGSVVPSGSRFLIEYSNGLILPNLGGEPAESSVKALTDAGFTVEASEAIRCPAKDQPAQVIRQYPSGGSRIDAASAVVFLETGFPRNVVPNVTGLHLHKARGIVEAAGLVVSVDRDASKLVDRRRLTSGVNWFDFVVSKVKSMNTTVGTVLCQGSEVVIVLAETIDTHRERMCGGSPC